MSFKIDAEVEAGDGVGVGIEVGAGVEVGRRRQRSLKLAVMNHANFRIFGFRDSRFKFFFSVFVFISIRAATGKDAGGGGISSF